MPPSGSGSGMVPWLKAHYAVFRFHIGYMFCTRYETRFYFEEALFSPTTHPVVLDMVLSEYALQRPDLIPDLLVDSRATEWVWIWAAKTAASIQTPCLGSRLDAKHDINKTLLGIPVMSPIALDIMARDVKSFQEANIANHRKTSRETLIYIAQNYPRVTDLAMSRLDVTDLFATES